MTERTTSEVPESPAAGGRGRSGDTGAVVVGPREELRHWTRWRIATVGALWIAGVVALAVISLFAHEYPTFPGDVGLAEGIQRLHQPILVAIVNFASDANWPTPAGIITVVVVAALALLRQFRAAIASAVTGFGADLANVTLNGLVARPRPHNVHIHVVAHLGLHSYPSGHVTHVVAFYGFLLYLSMWASRAHLAWRPWLRVGQAICLYFIVFIGPSRVLEGEHWPSDVLASYLLGALMLVVGIAVYHLLALGWLRVQARPSSM
jgi:undecaprenyl-diphosphatase